MQKKERNRCRKLFFQISLIIVPMFILTAAAISYVVYKNTISSYFSALQDTMRDEINTLTSHLLEIPLDKGSERIGWYFDWIEDNIEEAFDNITDEEVAAYKAVQDSDDGSLKWLENAPKLVQSFYGKTMMLDIDMAASKAYFDSNVERVFIMDVSEDHMGMVICDRSINFSKEIGSYYNDFSDQKVLCKLINGDYKTNEVVFERSEDFPQKGSLYNAYMALEHDGKPRAVIGIVREWTGYYDALILTIMNTLGICICMLVAVLVLLHIIIYRHAAAPISRIQETLRSYKEDKDSSKVVEAMSKIKVKNELGLLSNDISELAKEIDYYTSENVRLAAERERVAAELDMATQIQADQLPSDFPKRKEFDIYASMKPAKEVGGDFYDFFFVDDDHLALVIADVSGKGVPAALFMMMSKNLIHNLASMGLSPKEVMERANKTICGNNKHNMFVTVWLGILEISTGKITAVNAGHEIPVIRRPDGEFELFEEPHGLIVGVFKTTQYEQYEFTLPKGGTLFVYTDGVDEATNANDEMFKSERLLGALNGCESNSPEKLLEAVQTAVESFVGEAEQFDDLTMLGITLH